MVGRVLDWAEDRACGHPDAGWLLARAVCHIAIAVIWTVHPCRSMRAWRDDQLEPARDAAR